MDNEINFKTYLLLSPKKLSIVVNNNSETKKFFFEELNITNNSNELDFNLIEEFLEKNIFKIEKLLNNFIKNIYIILECDQFLLTQISIKENNFSNYLFSKNLKPLLNISKNQCKKTLEGQKITHMVIDKYKINNKDYNFLPKKVFSENFSLDISFTSLPIYFLKKIEVIMKKYQISISKVVSYEYLINYFDNEQVDTFEMAKGIINGQNENEVHLSPKTRENVGFFEKFFHFFR